MAAHISKVVGFEAKVLWGNASPKSASKAIIRRRTIQNMQVDFFTMQVVCDAVGDAVGNAVLGGIGHGHHGTRSQVLLHLF